MATNYKVNGVDLDQIFDPYMSGTKPAPTKYTVNGVDLKDIFAPRYLGASAPVTKYTVNGVDLNQIFAAKGSVNYNLPINDTSYFANQSGVNGSAKLIFNMFSSGSYSIVRSIRGVTTTLASGPWLPSGDSVANYTCYFSAVQSGVTLIGDADFNNITNAPASTPVALTTSRSYTADSNTFTTPGATATQTVDVICNYYRLGVLVHAVHVTFHTTSTS